MAKIIVITSGKGGVGKTTTAINLGAAMNHFGEEVLIVDANISTPNVGIHLGAPEVPINLNHVLSNKADLYEAIYEHDSGMRIIPSSLSIKESGKTNPQRLSDIKSDLKKLSKYVIVDSAAGLGEEAIASMDMADEIIIVTNAEMPAITDALKAIKTAEERNKKVLGVIITKVRKDNIELSPETVREMLEIPILGMIPNDLTVNKSLNMKDAVVHTHPKGKASRAYKEIAAKIVNAEYDSDKDKPNLWDRVFARKTFN